MTHLNNIFYSAVIFKRQNVTNTHTNFKIKSTFTT